MAGSCTRYPPVRACKYGEKRAHVVSANIGPRVSRTADVLGNGRAALRLRIFACVYCASSIEIEGFGHSKERCSIDFEIIITGLSEFNYINGKRIFFFFFFCWN